MARVLNKLTYANVVATLALFVALGGASYAALQLPKNSVGTKQLKKSAVTAQKIAKGAVTKAKLGADAQAALTGPAGPKGDPGPKGDQGSPGPSEALTAQAAEESLVDAADATQIASLTLPAGQWVLFADLSPEGTTGEPAAICYPSVGGVLGRTSRTQLAIGKQAGLVVIEPLTLSAPTQVALLCESHSGTFTVYGEETKVVALRLGVLR
ncbi:MAG TPA: collagen-like protein [Solirubrobacterales bacterium]|nr:collagen-like protein [Solirubrobacterales bacterium]